jgi:P27 family predicted phage terminase small subunit
MAGQRQPIELVVANGKKHLTKKEIQERQDTEVKPCTDNIAAPSYLTAAQKKQFDKIAGQLKKLGIMGETDCETLARYITSQSLYEQAVKDLRAIHKERPKDAGVAEMAYWAEMLDRLDKRVDRYFKQATTAASKLGLSITDRCKLVVPTKDEAPKANKFSVFDKRTGSA